jgi:flagellar motor protein MotB
MRHTQDTQLAEAHSALAQERERREAAEQASRNAVARASEVRSKLDLERAERERAASAPARTPEPEVSPTLPSPSRRDIEAGKSEARVQLLQRMKTYFETIDTPRGLVVTLSDRDFRGVSLDPAVATRIVNVAIVIAGQSGLRIEVDGHGEQWSGERAEAVRYALLRGGMPSGGVAIQDCGTTRPLVSNATASGREQNRRVEIVISGSPIGTLANWDRTYSLR